LTTAVELIESELHKGEAEAIVLARELKADWSWMIRTPGALLTGVK
jgi:predicted nucleic acid-binding protein